MVLGMGKLEMGAQKSTCSLRITFKADVEFCVMIAKRRK